MPNFETQEYPITADSKCRSGNPAFRDFFVNWCRKNQSPLHAAFADDVASTSAGNSESLRRQFVNSVFFRGTDMLLHNMPAPALPGRDEGQALYEVIQPERLGAELESLRASGDIAAISAKEREIADAIQGEVGKIDRKSHLYLPSDILSQESICCVSASLIGGGLMEKAGLNYLVGDVPSHSLLYLLTESGDVEWRDMLRSANNEKLTDEMISGVNAEGSPLTTKDIIAFSKKPHKRGLKFEIPDKRYRDKLPWIKEGEKQTITLLAPGHGQEVQVLGNLALLLYFKGKFAREPEEKRGFLEQAALAYQLAADGEPQLPLLHYGLGNTFSELERYEPGAEEFRKAVEIDPDFVQGYKGLVDCHCALGQVREAREAHSQFKRRAARNMTPFNKLSCEEAEKKIAMLGAGRELN